MRKRSEGTIRRGKRGRPFADIQEREMGEKRRGWGGNLSETTGLYRQIRSRPQRSFVDLVLLKVRCREFEQGALSNAEPSFLHALFILCLDCPSVGYFLSNDPGIPNGG